MANNIQNLKSFMAKHAINPKVIELTLKVQWDSVNESNALGLHKRLAHMLGVKFDPIAFKAIADFYEYPKDITAKAIDVEDNDTVKIMFGGVHEI